MRERLQKRFYCDFCSKSTARKDAMANHEAACTLNPDRVCKMCARVGNAQPLMVELIAAARIGLAELQATSNSCPACTLAAIRLLRKAEPEMWTETGERDAWGCPEIIHDPGGAPESLWEFDFKKAVAEFWQDFSADFD